MVITCPKSIGVRIFLLLLNLVKILDNLLLKVARVLFPLHQLVLHTKGQDLVLLLIEELVEPWLKVLRLDEVLRLAEAQEMKIQIVNHFEIEKSEIVKALMACWLETPLEISLLIQIEKVKLLGDHLQSPFWHEVGPPGQGREMGR